jgi:hypothetical protein
MKDDIKLCTISFSVVTLPVFFPLGQGHLLSAYSQCQEVEFCPIFIDVRRLFLISFISATKNVRL